MTIGIQPAISARIHRVTFQARGTPVPDGDGGYTEGYTDLDPPSLQVSIENATAADLERLASGTVIATATHVIRGPFHPGVDTKTRIQFVQRGKTRTFNVRGVADREERSVDMTLLCEELVE